ncbi:MAG: methyltransferase domain-containing protein [Candidatus Paceibacterota bacterium]|jgi:SAM-dependent methyltransferase
MNVSNVCGLIKNEILSVWYRGANYECPFCNKKCRKFSVAGIDKRANAKCPLCQSLERHRFLWLYLRNKTPFFEERIKVLDVAPTPFFQKMCKKLPNMEYVSADISSPIAMVKMDITDIKLPDEQFDCIICYHVLEHITEDSKAIGELFRILKRGGWAIIQSPIDPNREKTFEDHAITGFNDRIKNFGQGDHVRIYGLDYIKRLEEAGFIVRIDDYYCELPSDISQKYGLLKDEKIYFCMKKR